MNSVPGPIRGYCHNGLALPSISLDMVACAARVGWRASFLASPLSVSINGESIACGGGTPGVIRY
jgi:hypothetical protein